MPHVLSMWCYNQQTAEVLTEPMVLNIYFRWLHLGFGLQLQICWWDFYVYEKQKVLKVLNDCFLLSKVMLNNYWSLFLGFLSNMLQALVYLVKCSFIMSNPAF